MPTITFGDRIVELVGNESVLDALLRAGVMVASSCRAGSCQTCLVRGIRGAIPPAAQTGLKDTLRAQGYFLACVCSPTEDLEVGALGDDLRVTSRLVRREQASSDVFRLWLHPERDDWSYRAGQFVSLLRGDGLARSYSLASLPSEPLVEIHVRRLADGRMSRWLSDDLRVGDPVTLQGPSGSCFYVEGNADQTLLLVGTGTGLAPLYGIARDALARGHRGEIWLYQGGITESGLYLQRELLAWQDAHPHFRYGRSVLRWGDSVAVGGGNRAERAGVTLGPLDCRVLDEHPKPGPYRAFLCGDPAFVHGLKRKLFLAGMPMRELHADPFVESQHADEVAPPRDSSYR